MSQEPFPESLMSGSTSPQDGREKEKACVEQRSSWVLKALEDQGIRATQAPHIAVLGSGGGMRAHIAFLGVLSELKELGLLDAIMYLAGVSGSTWAMSSFYSNHGDAAGIETDLKQRFEHKEWHMLDSLKKAINSSSSKNYSLTDFWAYLVVSRQSREFLNSSLSSLKEDVEAGTLPYPIFAAIDNDLQPEWVKAKTKNSWFEFTPHHAGYPALGAYIPVTQVGSQFQNGKLSRLEPERDLSFLRGLWGSAIANMKENRTYIWDQILSLKNKLWPWNLSKKGSELEDIAETSQYALPIPGMSNEEGAVDTLLLDLLVAYSTDQKAPDLQEKLQALKQALDANPEEYGPVCVALVEKILTWATMSQEEQSQFLQYLVHACSSQGQPDHHSLEAMSFQSLNIPSLLPLESLNIPSFLNKTIICFWNWEWGTIYNYLHELGSVDDKIVQEMCSRKFLHLVDAGLAINSAYPLVLPPAREVQLILSFDFSSGDPFETVLATADYCSLNGIPFPAVDKAKLQHCATAPDSCYIFKGDTGPTVMHFPLFNKCNCADDIEAWRHKFNTFKISDTYSLKLVNELLDKAKENVRKSKQKILDTIQEIVGCCSKSS